MKELSNTGNGLYSLRWETRFIVTVFLAFCFAACLATGVLIAAKTGFAPGQVADYYTGNEEELMYGKTFGELIEMTHFHVFSVPLLLLVLGHVFLLCSWPRIIKACVVAASFLGAALYIASPWLIVYISRSLTSLVLVSRVLLGGTLLLFFTVPVYEMWKPPSKKPA